MDSRTNQLGDVRFSFTRSEMILNWVDHSAAGNLTSVMVDSRWVDHFICVVGGFHRKPLSKIFQPSRGEVCTSPILGPLASFCSLVENPTVGGKMNVFILNSFQIIYRYIQINKNDTRV